MAALLTASCTFDQKGALLPQPESFVEVGDGRDGDRTIDAAIEDLNDYTVVTQNVEAGATTFLAADAASLAPGDIVLLWQTVREFVAPPMPGDTAPVNLAENQVGGYEFNIVEQISGDMITVSRPLVHSYTMPGIQLLRVPQYENLNILQGASINVPAWNDTRGGIVAILVSGTLRNDGTIDVSGRGARGAEGGNAEPAKRGESVLFGDWSQREERNNRANGGGGGAFHNAGGGGGGHARQGGEGGYDIDDLAGRGGLGGAPLSYNPGTHAAFGGGGGSGHENDGAAGAGGAAGGIILIRAAELAGNGTYLARGLDGAEGVGDGSGGGGAGGAVIVAVTGGIACGSVDVSGGDGAVGDSVHGPGGGGSPGVITGATNPGACPTIARYGVAGLREDPSDVSPCHGALPCCGDNIVSGDEECDDGNRNDGDDCSATCEQE